MNEAVLTVVQEEEHEGATYVTTKVYRIGFDSADSAKKLVSHIDQFGGDEGVTHFEQLTGYAT